MTGEFSPFDPTRRTLERDIWRLKPKDDPLDQKIAAAIRTVETACQLAFRGERMNSDRRASSRSRHPRNFESTMIDFLTGCGAAPPRCGANHSGAAPPWRKRHRARTFFGLEIESAFQALKIPQLAPPGASSNQLGAPTAV
jgi:hypothetical protein